jgi:nucleoid DNA-binding protein
MAKKKASAKKKAMGKKKKVVGKKKAMGKKKKVAKKAAASGKKPPTKSEILTAIADDTELSKRDVAAVLESLTGLIGKNIGSRGPGYFNLPGLMKIKVNKKPAVKARKGINPFTGEEMMFKAKPARKVVKIAPLKSLKEMV